jgi:nitroreductase
MDEVLQVVKARRSVRDFEKKEIPKAVLDKLIDAILWAPSAGNLQARRFFFVSDQPIKKELVTAALGQHFLSEAPLVVVGCTDSSIGNKYGERGRYLYSVQDVACSIMNLMLVACENGLGSVWTGAFSEDKVAKILGLAGHLRPVVLVPVGYPSRVPKAPPRISAREAVIFITGKNDKNPDVA